MLGLVKRFVGTQAQTFAGSGNRPAAGNYRCFLKQNTATLSNDGAKVLLIKCGKVYFLDSRLPDFFTLLGSKNDIFRTNCNMSA